MAEKKTKKVEKKTDEPIKEVHADQNETTAEEQHQEVVAETSETTEAKEIKGTAKAGKRSTKAVKEAEEKAAKEERKASKAAEDETDKPKVVQKPARTKLERSGKKLRKVAELVEKDKEYSLTEASALIGKTNPTKFDATVELHVNLGVDPRQADQNIRNTISLPAGSGKTVKVAVFAEADDVAKAKKAGADIAGSDDFLQQLDKGVIDFDILIATPMVMAKLSKYARTLGPKGLMPNPKSGTVAADVAKAVTEAKGGRVEYRVDTTGIIHVRVGKASFKDSQISENVKAMMDSIKAAKPSSIKGTYVKSAYLTTTMGPSVRLSLSDLI